MVTGPPDPAQPFPEAPPLLPFADIDVNVEEDIVIDPPDPPDA